MFELSEQLRREVRKKVGFTVEIDGNEVVLTKGQYSKFITLKPYTVGNEDDWDEKNDEPVYALYGYIEGHESEQAIEMQVVGTEAVEKILKTAVFRD